MLTVLAARRPAGTHARAAITPVKTQAPATDDCAFLTPVKSTPVKLVCDISIPTPALLPHRSTPPAPGVVGQFLAIAPILLHGGLCAAYPPPLQQDWWAECAEIELAGPVLPSKAQLATGLTQLHEGRASPLRVQDEACFESDLTDLDSAGTEATPPDVDSFQLNPCATPTIQRVAAAGKDVAATPAMASAAPTPASPATPVGIVFVNKLSMPLQTPVLRAPPKTRKSRTPASAKTSRRSVRLAAKHREADPTKQAQKVLLKKLGEVLLSPVPDTEITRKFKATFCVPLSASKHEALQELFDGDSDPASLGIDAMGLEEVVA